MKLLKMPLSFIWTNLCLMVNGQQSSIRNPGSILPHEQVPEILLRSRKPISGKRNFKKPGRKRRRKEKITIKNFVSVRRKDNLQTTWSDQEPRKLRMERPPFHFQKLRSMNPHLPNS